MVLLQSESAEATSVVAEMKGPSIIESQEVEVVNIDERNESEIDERVPAEDDQSAVLAHFGFGAGMRMYEKSLAEAQKSQDLPRIDETAIVNHAVEEIPKDNVSSKSGKGIFSSISKTFSNSSKASKGISLTKSGSNISRASVLETKVSLSKTHSNISTASAAGSKISLTRSASNSSKASAAAKRTATDPIINESDALVIPEEPIVENVNDIQTETASVTKAPSIVREPSNVSKAASLVQAGSISRSSSVGSKEANVSNKVGNVSREQSISRSPSNLSQGGDVSKSPGMVKSPSTIIKAESNVETTDAVHKAPSMSRASSTISHAETKFSRVESIGKAPSVSQNPNEVGRTESNVGMAETSDRAPSVTESPIDALNDAEIAIEVESIGKAPSVSQNPSEVGGNESNIGMLETSERAPTVTESPIDALNEAEIAEVSKSIGMQNSSSNISKPPSHDQKEPSVANSSSYVSATSAVESSGPRALSDDISASPSIPKIPSSVSATGSVNRNEETVEPSEQIPTDFADGESSECSKSLTQPPCLSRSGDLSNAPSTLSKAKSQEVVKATSNLRERTEGTENLKQEAIELVQREKTEGNSNSYNHGEEYYIREGKYVGIIPGLEDEPCCAAEQVVRDFFTNADEMANAGPENLLPFDEAEEKKPNKPASKWWFW